MDVFSFTRQLPFVLNRTSTICQAQQKVGYTFGGDNIVVVLVVKTKPP